MSEYGALFGSEYSHLYNTAYTAGNGMNFASYPSDDIYNGFLGSSNVTNPLNSNYGVSGINDWLNFGSGNIDSLLNNPPDVVQDALNYDYGNSNQNHNNQSNSAIVGIVQNIIGVNNNNQSNYLVTPPAEVQEALNTDPNIFNNTMNNQPEIIQQVLAYDYGSMF